MPKSCKSDKTSMQTHLNADVLTQLGQSEMNSDQIAIFLADDAIVRTAAEIISANLLDFQSGPDLELYYDIEKQGEEMGFVSKGWPKPGFMVGDVLPVSIEHRDALRNIATKIRSFGAANGVTVDISMEEGEIACVGFNITLSKNEFDAKTLSKALDTIRTTVTAIERMLTLPPGVRVA